MTGQRDITHRNSKESIKMTNEACNDNMLQNIKASIQTRIINITS